MLEEYKYVNDHSKKGLRCRNMIKNRWLRDKEDWKGFTSYEVLSKLFKVHKDET